MALFNIAPQATPSAITSAGACTHSTASVTNTVASALVANANRKRAMLFNPPSATTTVVLGFDSTVTATTGVPLAPGQGWVEEGPIIHTGAFHALTSSGTGLLLCFDWS
ncbi:hypothetical protein [Microseira sp. BLCC-F43]|jgi:hypothetical protein|uniref:hypothetical protein n=1 Tax=Microseira sp. BLCC-F43 TaxID=3153602 RepID=UPI0035BB0F95